MREDYEKQTEELAQVIETLQVEKAELEKGIDVENPFLTAFQQYHNINKLTREVLIELVDSIRVHENGNISVRFKFADELRRISEFIEINTHSAAV